MSRLEEGTMSSAESQSNKPTATIGSSKRFHKKQLVLIGVAVCLILIAGIAYILVRNNEPSEDEQVREANAYVESVKAPAPVPSAAEQLASAKAQLDGKTTYTSEDLGSLVQAALTAQAAKKKAEAKQYAQDALVLIKQDKAYAESYPHIVAQLQEMAK
ncbi:hypothetical protein E6P97_01770 [Patescibacteria group bacterium]|nr:MAG: hypothetical protein E6P97_01770 [Patescibacteria group bacterium]